MELKIEALEKNSGILRILVILKRNGEINFQRFIDIYHLYPNSLYPAIEKAKGLGLIDVRIDASPRPRKKMIKLTEKGEKVAEHISMVNDLL
ncbi:MAG: hypothetical protein LVQ96_04545 [Thermoplasmatales archaeon]|nr:hypothetical protein [Thermoplasmatales archaeon]MCW6170424.1 hypothetical protein [Thermoplasmatales archaeon]